MVFSHHSIDISGEKVMVGRVVGGLGGLYDYIVNPSPSPFPLDSIDLGLGFGLDNISLIL